jgi:hypothetical protein
MFGIGMFKHETVYLFPKVVLEELGLGGFKSSGYFQNGELPAWPPLSR